MPEEWEHRLNRFGMIAEYHAATNDMQAALCKIGRCIEHLAAEAARLEEENSKLMILSKEHTMLRQAYDAAVRRLKELGEKEVPLVLISLSTFL